MFIGEGTIQNWRFYWQNNLVCAFIKAGKTLDKDFDSEFDYLNTPEKVGLLLDVLSMVTNLSISAKLEFYTFEANLDTVKLLMRKNKHNQKENNLTTFLVV